MSVRFLTLVRRVDKKRAGPTKGGRPEPLTVGSVCLLYAQADHANDDGWSFTGQERLGLETGMSARHVRRCLDELYEAGVLDWSRASRTAPNVYRLLEEGLAGKPTIPPSGSRVDQLPSGHPRPVDQLPSGPPRPVDQLPSGPPRPVDQLPSGPPRPVRPDTGAPPSGPPRPDKHQEASEEAREGDAAPAWNAARPGTMPDERAIRLDDPLPAELRAAAELLGLHDVDSAWLKFCAKHDGRIIAVTATWRGWCVSWRTNERSRRQGGAVPAAPPESPADRSVRLQREREARRAKDLEDDRYAREARGPLPGELTGALEHPLPTPRAVGGAR